MYLCVLYYIARRGYYLGIGMYVLEIRLTGGNEERGGYFPRVFFSPRIHRQSDIFKIKNYECLGLSNGSGSWSPAQISSDRFAEILVAIFRRFLFFPISLCLALCLFPPPGPFSITNAKSHCTALRATNTKVRNDTSLVFIYSHK